MHPMTSGTWAEDSPRFCHQSTNHTRDRPANLLVAGTRAADTSRRTPHLFERVELRISSPSIFGSLVWASRYAFPQGAIPHLQDILNATAYAYTMTIWSSPLLPNVSTRLGMWRTPHMPRNRNHASYHAPYPSTFLSWLIQVRTRM